MICKKKKSIKSIDRLGTEVWIKDGLYHRVDGPALIFPNGERRWYIKNYLHREDGPAIEGLGICRWFLNGYEFVLKEDYDNAIKDRAGIGDR